MSRNRLNYTHGDTGSKPISLNFEQNGRPNSQTFDWWWYNVSNAIDAHADEFDRLDSDNDGIVDEADYAKDSNASTYKENDIDTDGDGIVNIADYANDADASKYKGNDLDGDGDGIVDEADYAIQANNASDSDKLDGQHWSDIKQWVNNSAEIDSSSINGNDGQSAQYLITDGSTATWQYPKIPVVTNDPSNPEDGEFWIRSDL